MAPHFFVIFAFGIRVPEVAYTELYAAFGPPLLPAWQ